MPYISLPYTGHQAESWRGPTGSPDFNRLQNPKELSKTLATVRRLSLIEMAKPLAVPETANIIGRLGQMSEDSDGLLRICTLQKTGPDTVNDCDTPNTVFTVGFGGCPGTVDIGLSAALGLRWRLSADHPLAGEFPQLTHFEAREKDLPPGGPQQMQVDLQTLDQATRSVVDVNTMEADFGTLLNSFHPFTLKTSTSYLFSSGWPGVKEGFSSLGVDVYPQGTEPADMRSSRRLASVKLLFSPTGLKLVDISTLKNPDDYPQEPEHSVVQAASNLNAQNRMLTAG